MVKASACSSYAHTAIKLGLEKTTAKIAGRLTSWRSKIRNAGKRLMHVVLSPDPEMISDFLNFASKRRGVTLTDLIQTLRDEALSYLSAKSNRKPAGVFILHPCRPNELYYEERGKERREEEERPTKGIGYLRSIIGMTMWGSPLTCTSLAT